MFICSVSFRVFSKGGIMTMKMKGGQTFSAPMFILYIHI